MNGQKSKIKVWNYESQEIKNAPEVQNHEPSSWSETGKGLGSSSKEYNMLGPYLLVPMVILILIIGFAFSRSFALVLEVVCFIPLVILYNRANQKAGKGGALFFWLLLALVLASVILLVPTRF